MKGKSPAQQNLRVASMNNLFCDKYNYHSNKGFTLVEIMVAIAILAISMTAIIRSTGQVSTNAFLLRQKTFAHWVAQNKMNELLITKAWPNTGKDKDEANLADLDWELEIETESTPVETIRKVTIYVSAAETPDSVATSLSGYLLDPSLIQGQSK